MAQARRGRGLLYRGGYHGARQLLAGMARRLAPSPTQSCSRPSQSHPAKSRQGASPPIGGIAGLASAFLAQREQARLEHELLALLCVPLSAGWRVDLRKAPDVTAALEEALGPWPGLAPEGPAALPLRDLLGMVGAHEWRRRGVEVPALGARVHPHHGVYAPIRGEYVDLVARAIDAWPVAGKRALDVGTGTGVLALLLARRGATVLATDLEPRAVRCARENAARLGLAGAVEVREADLFPGGAPADLVVSNPPWLPAAAHSPLDRAVYDPGGAFLERLVAGLPAALAPGGEAWVVMSDLAERLGLRPAGHLEALAARAGLSAAAALEARPVHPRARDEQDPLHEARAAEIVRLVRLVRG
jgi:methylase of polypeptide subunit release factors